MKKIIFLIAWILFVLGCFYNVHAQNIILPGRQIVNPFPATTFGGTIDFNGSNTWSQYIKGQFLSITITNYSQLDNADPIVFTLTDPFFTTAITGLGVIASVNNLSIAPGIGAVPGDALTIIPVFQSADTYQFNIYLTSNLATGLTSDFTLNILIIPTTQ